MNKVHCTAPAHDYDLPKRSLGLEQQGYACDRHTDSLSYPVTNDAIKPKWGLNQDIYLTKIGEGSAQPGFRVYVPLVQRSS